MLSYFIFTSFVVAGQAAIRCGGRIPLRSVSGLDLYCGSGAAPCPSGSYCQIDSDALGSFAVCCPVLLPSLPLASGLIYASLPSTPLYYASSLAGSVPPVPVSVYASSFPNAASNIYVPPPNVGDPLVTTTNVPPPEPVICPETGTIRKSCPINSCLTADCFGVPGASCMVDYCGNCGPKWYGPDNRVLSADQCNWIPQWNAQLQAFSSIQQSNLQTSAQAIQQTQPALTQPLFTQPALNQPVLTQPAQTQSSAQPLAQSVTQPASVQSSSVSSQTVFTQAPSQQQNFQPSAPVTSALPSGVLASPTGPLQVSFTQPNSVVCPVAPNCSLDFLSPVNRTNITQQPNATSAQRQEISWQLQAQQTSCQYTNPLRAPNGCLMSCGTLVCDGPVRFLQIAMGQGSAVATWVPPLSALLGQTYLAELSYDGQNWRTLPLEQPWATFARFQVDQDRPFQLRVTADGYPSAVQIFSPEGSNIIFPSQAIPGVVGGSIESSESIESAESIESSEIFIMN